MGFNRGLIVQFIKNLILLTKCRFTPIHFCRDHLLIHAEQNILRIVGLKRYKLLHGGFNGVRVGWPILAAALARMGDGYLAGSKKEMRVFGILVALHHIKMLWSPTVLVGHCVE